MKKYEYDFVAVKPAGWYADDYRDIINERAKEGWRFITAIVKITKVNTYTLLDLVFEREVEE